MTNTAPAILFDLDGTLADTAPDLTLALNFVLEGIGAPMIAPDKVRHLIGMGARALIERGMEASGQIYDDALLDQLLDRFLRYYADNIARESRVFPGVTEMLRALKTSGAKLAVCTNKREHSSLHLLRALDLLDYFDAVAGGDTFAVHKPDGRHLLQTLERIGAQAGQAVMVGDSETDVRAARSAGLPVIGVTFGYTDRHISTFAPDAVISHFDALMPELERLLGPLAR